MHFKGADQPGGRAVLEETNSTSDRMNSTLKGSFSQAETDRLPSLISILFSEMELRIRR
jgi:hypothetical protein